MIDAREILEAQICDQNSCRRSAGVGLGANARGGGFFQWVRESGVKAQFCNLSQMTHTGKYLHPLKSFTSDMVVF